MKIHADPTTDGTGIALDVDHPGTIHILDAAFIPCGALVLTPDEAAELRDELTRALDKIAPKTRTPADVLTDPQPGDRVEWEDGEVWTVTGRDTQILHDVTPPDGGGRTYGDRMGLDIWADPMDDGNGSPFVCIPVSDAPPPTA